MKCYKATIGILSIIASNVMGQDDQVCKDRTPDIGARFQRKGTDCCSYSEVKCFITDESYYLEGYDPRSELRCNRNIRADPTTTKNGTDYPKVEVRLEYKLCNWNQNPNYKILLNNDNARFSEWHAKTDNLVELSDRTIYEKKWVNRILNSQECITVVQNTTIDTSLGDHNLDALIQGNAVINGVTIIPGTNGEEFCYAYAFERILLDKGECDVDTTVNCFVMDGSTVTTTHCQTKIDNECPSNRTLTFDAQFQWTACNGENRLINLSSNSNYNFNGQKEYVEDLQPKSCSSFITTDKIDCVKEKTWSMYIQGESWQPGGTPFIDKQCVDYSSKKLFIPQTPEPNPVGSSSPTVSHAPSTSQTPTNFPSSTYGPSNNPTVSQKPSISHSPTLSANPTVSQKPSTSHAPSISFNPTVSQKPSTSHAPSLSANPTVSQKPSVSHSPSLSVDPTLSQKPSTSHAPTLSHSPSLSVDPTLSQKPSTSHSPTLSANPTVSQKPSTSHAPSLSANPTVSQKPTMKYNPSVNPTISQIPSSTPSQMPTKKTPPGETPPSLPSKGGKGAKTDKIPTTPKDPKAPIDPKKGSDSLTDGISKVVEDSSSTTSLKTIFSIAAAIMAGLLVF